MSLEANLIEHISSWAQRTGTLEAYLQRAIDLLQVIPDKHGSPEWNRDRDRLYQLWKEYDAKYPSLLDS